MGLLHVGDLVLDIVGYRFLEVVLLLLLGVVLLGGLGGLGFVGEPLLVGGVVIDK